MLTKDPWARYRQLTRARIGLGRSGDALPTTALLSFQHAHALARDAVHSPVDFTALQTQCAPLPLLRVHSAAPDRATYLRRPDLGRRLTAEDRAHLTDLATPCDVLFVIADGLSAAAVMAHAVAVARRCIERLGDWQVGPLVYAEQARVAIGDEIGALLHARLVVVLIGERPGLSVANSLGLYLTWAPHVGMRDAQRNCISNVHASGLSHAQAADKALWLIREATQRRLTGVDLKEAAPEPPAALAAPLQSLAAPQRPLE